MFSQLDLDQAYQHVCVDEDTTMLRTVATHKGMFKVTRLQFGVAVVVATFNVIWKHYRTHWKGFRGFYMTSSLAEEQSQHDERLRYFLLRVQDDELRLMADNCAFRDKKLTYLVYRINKDRVGPFA